MGKSLRFYEILRKYGLPENIDKEGVRAYFKKKLWETHPDRNKNPGAEEKFKEFNSDLIDLTFEFDKEELRKKIEDTIDPELKKKYLELLAKVRSSSDVSDLDRKFEEEKKQDKRTASASTKNPNSANKDSIDLEDIRIIKEILAKYQNNEFLNYDVTKLLLDIEKINDQNYDKLVKEIIGTISLGYFFAYPNDNRGLNSLSNCKDLKTLIKKYQSLERARQYENAPRVDVDKNRLYKLKGILVKYADNPNPLINSIVQLLSFRVDNAINKENETLNENDVKKLSELMQLILNTYYNRLVMIFEKNGNFISEQDKLKFAEMKQVMETLSTSRDIYFLIDTFDAYERKYKQELTPNQSKYLNKILSEHQQKLDSKIANTIQGCIEEYGQKREFDFSSYLILKILFEAIIIDEKHQAELESEDTQIYDNYLSKITVSDEIKELISMMLKYAKDLAYQQKATIINQHSWRGFDKISSFIEEFFKRK